MANREEQNKAILDFIELEVVPRIADQGDYVRKIDDSTRRFEAIRSIKGLEYGADPMLSPKLEPWEGSSDIGVPIEAITLRAIIARFVKTIFTKPICNVGGRGGQDQEDAKVVEEYNEYTLEDEMNFERQFYDVMMDVGLAGDGYGKLIEANEEYEWEDTYFTLINPETGEPILDPETANEYDDKWPNGYPIEVSEGAEPAYDPQTDTTPIVQEIVVEKKENTYFGTKLIPVDPRDMILPEGADTTDMDELAWIGHRFRKDWYWLKAREGDPKDGGYENIDAVKPDDNNMDNSSKVIRNIKIPLVEIWGRVNLDGVDSTSKPKEIIALYAIDKKELLGWIENPYRGKRMIFHWQIMPMSHRARGKSIPEFAKGIRNLVDSMFNNMIDRDTINTHPPFLYNENSGFDPDLHEFGPAEMWGVNDQTGLGRLPMGNTTEFNSQWIIEFSMGMLQKLFGVSDYTLGSESNIASNKTARGIQAIIGEGNMSFDTMITLLQMTNKKFFAANIRMHAKMMKDHGMEKRVFYVTESEKDPMREIARNSLSLNWNFLPRGTSLEANIYKKREDSVAVFKLLGAEQSFSPIASPESSANRNKLVQNILDSYIVKGISLQSIEQINQAQVQQKAQVEQEIQKQAKLEQLKTTAKTKKDTPEGIAAQKVIDSIENSPEANREKAVKTLEKERK